MHETATRTTPPKCGNLASPEDAELFQAVVEYLRAEVDFRVVCDSLDTEYGDEFMCKPREKCADRFHAADRRLDMMISERDKVHGRYTSPGDPSFPGPLGLYSLLMLFDKHIHSEPEMMNRELGEIADYILKGIRICRRAMAHEANEAYAEGAGHE